MGEATNRVGLVSLDVGVVEQDRYITPCALVLEMLLELVERSFAQDQSYYARLTRCRFPANKTIMFRKEFEGRSSATIRMPLPDEERDMIYFV